MDASTRFWMKVNKDGPVPNHNPSLGQCWLWIGYKSKSNSAYYGVFSVGRERIKAHRFSYQQSIGVVRDGLQLDHLCRNTLCIRPEHLEAVTASVNLSRRHGFCTRTHCQRGHEFTPENTCTDDGRWRCCRLCKNAAQRKRRLASVAGK